MSSFPIDAFIAHRIKNATQGFEVLHVCVVFWDLSPHWLRFLTSVSGLAIRVGDGLGERDAVGVWPPPRPDDPLLLSPCCGLCVSAQGIWPQTAGQNQVSCPQHQWQGEESRGKNLMQQTL